mgnify:CR=1 FL=1
MWKNKGSVTMMAVMAMLVFSLYGIALYARSVSSYHVQELQIKTIQNTYSRDLERAHYIATDVSSKKSVKELAEKTVSEFGGIDILINNAGVTIPESPVFDVTEEQWDFVHNVDLKGLYFTSQVIAEKMKQLGNGGRIVNLTSAAGIMTPKYVSVYGAAKAGVRHLTGIMAKEWARWGINVNAVAPGYVNTDMLAPMLENEKNAQVVLKSIPMRRYGEVKDVANVILFLVTEASDYLTGVIIPIDGGMMA